MTWAEMKTPLLILSLVCTMLMPSRADAQFRFGGSMEFFLPLGDLTDISEVGISFDLYGGSRLSRRSPWAVEFDAGVHWFLPYTIDSLEVPDWVSDPDVNSDDEVSLSGTFIPIRGSFTRFFGRYYFSPRVGIYIPAGDFKGEAGFSTAFGVAPRLGYFFPISRDVQFDMAIEYDYQFSEPVPVQYVGFSMGLFFGGQKLRRRLY